MSVSNTAFIPETATLGLNTFIPGYVEIGPGDV